MDSGTDYSIADPSDAVEFVNGDGDKLLPKPSFQHILHVNIKLLSKTAVKPLYGSFAAAGMDLFADETCTIEPHGTKQVKTGIAIEIPRGYFGGLYARSGLVTKQNLRPANCVGIIDADYRGEVIVSVFNDSDTATATITAGTRIAQLVIQPVPLVWLHEVDELSDTARGSNGFGSTGE